MKILAIETSCDETAISIIEAEIKSLGESFEGGEIGEIKILSQVINSQIEIHKEFGGVFPNLAKREHSKNIVPVCDLAFKEAKIESEKLKLGELEVGEIKEMLQHEPELFERIVPWLKEVGCPKIDLIAVTEGPGLEPALWVGINFARVLAKVWQKKIVAINHMEGHLVSALLQHQDETKVVLPKLEFPAVALLVSGGHTQIVQVEAWGKYKVIGETQDDAVGEAFDKVARLLDLEYPGGPKISQLAKQAEEERLMLETKFPRPMLHSGDLNFSFSGIKTAVRYYIEKNFGGGKLPELTESDKKKIARDFEDSAVEVLTKKIARAADKVGAQNVLAGGGVIANAKLRRELKKIIDVPIWTPYLKYSTDNATMIAVAALLKLSYDPSPFADNLKADGNKSL